MNKILKHFHCLNSTVLVVWFSFAFIYVCMYVCMYVFTSFGGGGVFLLRFSFLFSLALLSFYYICFVLVLFCGFWWVVWFFLISNRRFLNASIQFYKGNRLKIANIQLPMLLVDVLMCVARAHYMNLIA